MAFNKSDRPDGAKMRRPGGMRRRKKVCVFCGDKNGTIDYKDVNKLNSSQKNYRQLCKAPESPDRSHQARASHRSDALHLRLGALFYKGFRVLSRGFTQKFTQNA